MKIAILSRSYSRMKSLMKEFYETNIDQIKSSYTYCEQYNLIVLSDGTELHGRSVTMPPEKFTGYHFDQIFSEIEESEIPLKLDQIIRMYLFMHSSVPEEFQWIHLN